MGAYDELAGTIEEPINDDTAKDLGVNIDRDDRDNSQE